MTQNLADEHLPLEPKPKPETSPTSAAMRTHPAARRLMERPCAAATNPIPRRDINQRVDAVLSTRSQRIRNALQNGPRQLAAPILNHQLLTAFNRNIDGITAITTGMHGITLQ